MVSTEKPRVDPEDLREIVKTVREFVRERVVPRELEIEQTDRVPDDLRQAAVEMGLFGYTLPTEFGGLGFSLSDDVQVAFELGWTTPAFRSMFGTNNGIAGQVLVNFGTRAQQERYLPRLTSGEVACFCLTEPEAGSDPSGLRTKAVRDGEEYVLNGSKRYITNAAFSDLFVVFARTGPQSEGGRNISVFLVEKDTPGLTVAEHDAKMGQRGAWTSDVYLDDARVPASALVGEQEGKGFAAAMRSLARGRVHIAAVCVGVASRILDESVRYAAENRQGGQPIANFQLVQGMLAEMQTDVFAARATVVEAARLYDSGEDTRMAPSAAKLFASEMVDRVADRGVQVHGGAGYMQEVPVERFYRDSRLFRLYEGTSEIQKLIIARQLLSEL
ncbi:MAG TPA: acyl-CoA dehydrogenase family protein [Solirubrobacteraceae bacterium]|jgi:acyl-CoA dehydrogenase|nr:acyl-CoA dehydrogenase family protein [Solirubrobacteraceae bacterium]